jgi:hypothetical protein
MVATGRFARALAAMAIAAGVVTGTLIAVAPVEAATPVTMLGGPTSPTVAPGSQVTVSVLLTNTGSAALKPGTFSVAPSTTPLLDEASLNDWLAARGRDSLVIAETAVPTIAPRSSFSATVSFSAQKLPDPAIWGVRGLLATYSSGTLTTTLRTTVVVLAPDSPQPIQLATLLPIVGRASALGLMGHDELAAATAANGYLTQTLAVATTGPVTLAVDPRIPTSILALGTGAPASATSWLAALGAANKPGFWLTFGDSDISGQIQAGAKDLIQPGIDDLSLIPAAPAGLSWDGLNWPGWTPTIPSVAWPLANTVSEKVMPAVKNSGYTSTIISDGNLSTAANANSSALVDGMPTAVVNDSASACAQRLEQAETVSSRAFASACLSAHLAVVATGSRTQATVIVALARSQSSLSVGSFSNALTTLAATPFAQSISLNNVFSASKPATTLVPKQESSARRGALANALTNQSRIDKFAPVAELPNFVINPGQRRLAAIASSSWLGNTEWPTGLAANRALTAEVLSSVAIVSSSTINMVSGQARIPVVVRNDLPTPVAVTVHAVPSNARIEVKDVIPLTVQANAQARAYIPVTARVGSGDVTLKVSLTDSAGTPVGSVTNLPVNVRADWEVFGLLGLAVVFFGLLIAGVIRTLRRRAKKAASHE